MGWKNLAAFVNLVLNLVIFSIVELLNKVFLTSLANTRTFYLPMLATTAIYHGIDHSEDERKSM